MPHGGLALANSLATFLEMGVLLVLLRRRLDGLGGGRVLSALGQAGLGGLAMAAGLWAWLSLGARLPGLAAGSRRGWARYAALYRRDGYPARAGTGRVVEIFQTIYRCSSHFKDMV